MTILFFCMLLVVAVYSFMSSVGKINNARITDNDSKGNADIFRGILGIIFSIIGGIMILYFAFAIL